MTRMILLAAVAAALLGLTPASAEDIWAVRDRAGTIRAEGWCLERAWAERAELEHYDPDAAPYTITRYRLVRCAPCADRKPRPIWDQCQRNLIYCDDSHLATTGEQQQR